jgi:arylformamidase
LVFIAKTIGRITSKVRSATYRVIRWVEINKITMLRISCNIIGTVIQFINYIKKITLNMVILDLTQEISCQTKVFPGDHGPHFIQWARSDIHGYDSEVMVLSTHTGTHMDAPSHFVRNGRSIDMIPSGRFVSKAVLFKIHKESNETINLEDITDVHHHIEENDVVIFSTGWERMVTSENYFSNPGLSEGVAILLVEKRVNMVGIDGPSIDVGTETGFAIHKILLPNDVLIIENLCNLDTLEHCSRFEFVAAPLKLRAASGSTMRAIAIKR